jgi:integrase
MQWFHKRENGKSEHYKYLLTNRLKNQILPALGATPIDAIEPQGILALLHTVEERGAIEQAKRLGRIIKQVCSYAVACGYTKYNAASEIMGALSSAGEIKHRATLTKPQEVGALLRALDMYQGDISVCYALRILPYVFVRSQELRGARWEEIDFDKAEWVVPAERMKMKAAHVVPLARQVVKLFLELRSWSGGSALCFPSPWSKSRCISDVGLLNAIRRLGYGKDEMCIHGFRSMASTLLNEQGYRPDVIEAQLAHAEKNAIRRAYNHAEYLPERRTMMQEWADYLDGLRDGAA